MISDGLDSVDRRVVASVLAVRPCGANLLDVADHIPFGRSAEIENTKTMQEKPKADETNNYFYNNSCNRLQATCVRKWRMQRLACGNMPCVPDGLRVINSEGKRPVLQYIADFLCKELKLVIEVDGITHLDDETGEKIKQEGRARPKRWIFANQVYRQRSSEEYERCYTED